MSLHCNKRPTWVPVFSNKKIWGGNSLLRKKVSTVFSACFAWAIAEAAGTLQAVREAGPALPPSRPSPLEDGLHLHRSICVASPPFCASISKKCLNTVACSLYRKGFPGKLCFWIVGEAYTPVQKNHARGVWVHPPKGPCQYYFPSSHLQASNHWWILVFTFSTLRPR